MEQQDKGEMTVRHGPGQPFCLLLAGLVLILTQVEVSAVIFS